MNTFPENESHVAGLSLRNRIISVVQRTRLMQYAFHKLQMLPAADINSGIFSQFIGPPCIMDVCEKIHAFIEEKSRHNNLN